MCSIQPSWQSSHEPEHYLGNIQRYGEPVSCRPPPPQQPRVQLDELRRLLTKLGDSHYGDGWIRKDGTERNDSLGGSDSLDDLDPMDDNEACQQRSYIITGDHFRSSPVISRLMSLA